jgi:hypothetical protein
LDGKKQGKERMNEIEQRTTAMPFEQQRKESHKAFAAFRAYLELGAERSLALVAEKLGKSKTMMEKWSRKFDWPARVQAHAAHVADLERKAIEGRAVEKAVEWEKTHEAIRREAWAEAEKSIAMVRKAREQWEARGRVPGWEGMVRMLEVAFKLKQFAAGMPSEIKEVNTTVTGKVSVEWEAAIRKAYAVEAQPPPSVLPPTVVDVQEVKP